jgi:hypothetical protein
MLKFSKLNKKGKIITLASAGVLAAAIITTAMISAYNSKDIVLRQTPEIGNMVSVSSSAGTGSNSDSSSKSAVSSSSESKASVSKTNTSSTASKSISTNSTNSNTVTKKSSTNSSTSTKKTTSYKSNTTSTKKSSSGSTRKSNTPSSSGSKSSNDGGEIIVSELPTVNRGSVDNVSVTTKYEPYSKTLFITLVNHNDHDVYITVNGKKSSYTTAPNATAMRSILGTASKGDTVTITIENKSLSFKVS